MKLTIKTLATLFVVLFILSSCSEGTCTHSFYHIVVVDAADDVEYSITAPTYVSSKQIKHFEYQNLKGRDYVLNGISGRSLVGKLSEEVEYTLNIENNDSRESSVTMYVLEYQSADNPLTDIDIEITDEIMDWVRENYEYKCTLEEEEESKSIVMELVQGY